MHPGDENVSNVSNNLTPRLMLSLFNNVKKALPVDSAKSRGEKFMAYGGFFMIDRIQELIKPMKEIRKDIE